MGNTGIDEKHEDFKKYVLNEVHEKMKTQVPIRKGCRNGQCFCTGACQEIVGWRDKTPDELFNDQIQIFYSKNEKKDNFIK